SAAGSVSRSAANACAGDSTTAAASSAGDRARRSAAETLGKSQYIIPMPDANQIRKNRQRATPSQRCTKTRARIGGYGKRCVQGRKAEGQEGRNSGRKAARRGFKPGTGTAAFPPPCRSAFGVPAFQRFILEFPARLPSCRP